VAATSLAEIAQAADVPLGNVYYYFKSKDELIRAVVAAHIEEVDTVMSWTRLRRVGAGCGQPIR
jgi:TetR/AcrR family transcriptional regulator, transcriptional repressor for nem operon